MIFLLLFALCSLIRIFAQKSTIIMMKFIGIIPARYASTRFPGKPLAVLGNRPVIQHVYEKAVKALGEAYVATDDERIFDAVKAFGGEAVMTRTDHKSGTDRIEEACEKIGTNADVIINIQGDEPFVSLAFFICSSACSSFPSPIDACAQAMK